MLIEFRQKGDFNNSKKFLNHLKNLNLRATLEKYGKAGVDALSAATPKDTGKTAESWTYEIKGDKNSYSIEWHNSNVNEGVNIAVILQYGHGTGNGGWVEGRDYINPALRPIFDQIANEAWEEVIRRR